MNARLRVLFLTLSVLALAVGPLVGGVSGAAPDARTATLNGQPIPLSEVAGYHCNDLAYPAIRCFSSKAAVIADVAQLEDAGGTGLDGPASVLSTACVWYWNGGYGGASFFQSTNQSNLSALGWNDAISSFEQLGTHQCRWYADGGYTGAYWTWTAGLDVSYVGDGANDKFSSVWILQ
jgi:hypothetical protein